MKKGEMNLHHRFARFLHHLTVVAAQVTVCYLPERRPVLFQYGEATT
jgi:hypothetical protein